MKRFGRKAAGIYSAQLASSKVLQPATSESGSIVRDARVAIGSVSSRNVTINAAEGYGALQSQSVPSQVNDTRTSSI